MKKLFALIFVLISCSGDHLIDYEFDDYGYFPLHVGNKWVYQFSLGGLHLPESFTVEITGMKKIDNNNYYILDQFYSSPKFSFNRCYARMENNNIYIKDWFNEEIRFKFKASEMTEWKYTHEITGKFFRKNEELNISLGLFTNCYVFGMFLHSYRLREYLAENIGIVQIFIDQDFRGVMMYELKEAVINGEKIGGTEISKITKNLREEKTL